MGKGRKTQLCKPDINRGLALLNLLKNEGENHNLIIALTTYPFTVVKTTDEDAHLVLLESLKNHLNTTVHLNEKK